MEEHLETCVNCKSLLDEELKGQDVLLHDQNQLNKQEDAV